MKKATRLLSTAVIVSLIISSIFIIPATVSAVPAEYCNLLLNNRNALTKLEMKSAVDADADILNAASYESQWASGNYEEVWRAVDGDTVTCSSTGGFKPSYQYSESGENKIFSNIGWLMDFGCKQDFSVYRTYYWTDNGKIDTRKQKGIIYAGNDSAALKKVAEFDNSAGKVSNDVDLSGVSARFVAVVLINKANINSSFNWYTMLRTFMAEIEIYGKEAEIPLEEYDVKFEAGENSTCNETSRKANNKEPIGVLPVPEKEGKIFVGWYSADGNRMKATDYINGDITLYAKFANNFACEAVPSKIKANKSELPASEKINFTANEHYEALSDGNNESLNGNYLHSSVLAFTKEEGYDCIGLAYDLGGYYSMEQLRIYLCPDSETNAASWKKLLRNVSGEIYVGDRTDEMIKVASFTHSDTNEAMLLLDLPGSAGRYVNIVFTDFYHDINISKLYIYELQLLGGEAPLNSDQYSVSFIYDGEIFSGGAELERRLTKGTALGSLPQPVRIGYKFEGWYTNLNDNNSKVTEQSAYAENISLYAKWTVSENLILGKLGVKVVAPKNNLSDFVLSRYNGNEFHQAEVSGRFRANDGNRGGKLEDALCLDVSYATDELTAGLLYDLGTTYNITSLACFQDFSGFHTIRTIRGMRIYAGNSLYDLCDEKNLIAEVTDSSQLIKYWDLNKKSISARFVVFFFTEPTTDPATLNSSPVGGKHDELDDDGTVAYIHELEVYGTLSDVMPEPNYQNVILTKEPDVYVAKGGKFDAGNMEEAIFASGVSSYLTLDYTRVNELDVAMKRQYTNGYSYSFTNAFGDDGDLLVYKFTLDELTEIHQLKCGYNWAAPEKMSWDVYVSENEDNLFIDSNRISGKTMDGNANFVLDIAKKGKYIAFVVSVIDRYKSAQVSTLEIYAGEKLPSNNVSFEYQGATSAITESNRVVSFGKKIGKLPTPRKTDLTFEGWNTQPDGKGKLINSDYVVTSKMTLYAVWGDHIKKNKYLYSIEDGSAGVKAEIHLNGQLDIMTTFVKLNTQTSDNVAAGVIKKGLKECYYIHDIFNIQLNDMRGDLVDIEGRKITLYLPIKQSLNIRALSVAVYYNDEVELIPCTIKNGYAIFDTYVTATYALVEANYTENASQDDIEAGKLPVKNFGLSNFGWWTKFFN